MRAAALVFVVCTLIGVTAVFLPSVQVVAGGDAVHRKAALSLYQANTNRAFVEQLVVRYHHSKGGRLGAALIGVLAPRSPGKLGSVLGDIHDATDTLDELKDSDASTLARILAVVVWAFLALHVVMGGIVLVDAVNGTNRRGRTITAVVLSVLVTLVAIALYLATKEAVWEANDEIGRDFVGTAFAAYLQPGAAIAGLVAVITLLVLQVRAARQPTQRIGA